MTLRVVGVGLGRTGTNSLKLALERLLGGPCHHMIEVIKNPEQQMPLWKAAVAGAPDWPAIFAGYVATVDWPATAFWRPLIDVYPDALVLLSKRESADAWWKSARSTIFSVFNDGAEAPPPDMMEGWIETVHAFFQANGIDPADEATAKAAYARHLEDVRATVPPARLLEWTTGDGWAPLCKALGVAVPDEPFPHVNTTEQFLERRAAMRAS